MRAGIDLGTTYSLIARLDYEGKPILLPDQAPEPTFHTPSVVYVARDCAFVGRVVETLLEQDPGLTVARFFKRQLGSTAPVLFGPDGTPWHAEALAALVLKKLRLDAESFCHDPVESVAITVPAHFNDVQRKAVLAAAAMADLPVLGLVEEPVAAALHYGVEQARYDQVILVYDWGGGTFDATALSLTPEGVFVLAKGGLTEVGGKELDERVAEIVLRQFERALGTAPSLSARTVLELRRLSEDVKIELCAPARTRVRRTALLGGRAIEIDVARAEFDAAIASLIDQTEAVTAQCLADAGLTRADVGTVLMVGGSSMVPAVGERLRGLFGSPSQRVQYHEPSKAVAFGAALRAAQMSGDAGLYNLPPQFRGVSGYAVGIRTINPQNGRVAIDTLIKQNMPLPLRVARTYYTTRPDQERVTLEVVQFRGAGEDVVSLGQLVVGPLPSPRVNYPVNVTVEALEDGTVRLEAHDSATGVELAQVFGRESDGGFAHLGMQRALVRNTSLGTV